jgi:hypothetical protein
MNDDPAWFAAKRYGYGAGLPVRWQGWAATGIFGAAAALCAYLTKDRPAVAIAVMVPVVFVFLVVTARKTRGGWHWRWGDKD